MGICSFTNLGFLLVDKNHRLTYERSVKGDIYIFNCRLDSVDTCLQTPSCGML